MKLIEYKRKLFAGERSLKETFWLYGIFVLLVNNLVLTYMKILGLPNKYAFGNYVFNAMVFLSVCYAVMVYIAIWKSANRYNGAIVWAVAAKLMVILLAGAMLNNILNLINK